MEEEKLPNRENKYINPGNGWYDFTTVPEEEAQVNYINYITGQKNNQKVITNTDIAISHLIRKGKNGEKEFALVETIVPSTIKREGYNGILLEVPFFALPSKDKLQYEEIVAIIDKGILDLNLYMEGNLTLDGEKTPIQQSFSDQCGQFFVSAVSERKGESDSRLHWIPISELKSYINLQLNGGADNIHSSLQSLYALKLLQNKYEKELSLIPEQDFKIDKPVKGIEVVSQVQTVKNSPRFTIEDVVYADETGKKEYSTYAGSRDSMAVILLVEDEKKGEYNLILSKQQRSPFVENKELNNGILNEVVGGMVEKGQSLYDTAIAESEQEQGYKLSKEDLVLLAKPFIASLSAEEFGAIFVGFANPQNREEMKLDKDENSTEAISGEQEYVSLSEAASNLERISPAPIATKLAVLLANDYVQERKKEQDKAKKDESREQEVR